MNRRELLRNSLLTIGAAASLSIPVDALVFASGDDASRELARPDWKPVFLNAQQNDGAAFNLGAAGFGAACKNAVKQGIYGIWVGAFGESLARDENFVFIDPELKDAWGIPALHISMAHGENEKAIHEDAAKSAAEILEAAGARNIQVRSTVAEPGMAIHELDTARMGADPKTSVTDSYCQLHDVENVFAMDGACFVSSGCQNPTLTMMAITVRACDRLIDRFKKYEI